MIQTYEKALEIERIKVEVNIPEENERDELLGDLNPRYFEEAMAPENVLDKVHAARISNNLIRPY